MEKPPYEIASVEDPEDDEREKSDLFINYTDVEQITEPERRRKVRRHVMRRVQQDMRSRTQSTRANSKILLDIAPLRALVPRTSLSEAQIQPGISTRPESLGGGRSNPFIRYPIDMNLRAHELFDHLHGNTCPMFKTLNQIGFFRHVLDPAAFRQILCTSSSHMGQLRNTTEEKSEAIALSTEAIRSINTRLANPALANSDGILVSVLAFVCHTVMFNDIPGSSIHFSGLEEIIRRRGGVGSLNSALRLVLFWADTNTAFLNARAPRFSCPYDILPLTIEPTPNAAHLGRLLQYCLEENMVNAMKNLYAINHLIVSELQTRDLWDDGVFGGLHVLPILHELLSSESNSTFVSAFGRQEMCRLGAILYLAAIRQRFRINLVRGVYISRLKTLIATADELGIDQHGPLFLWCLLIAGASTKISEEREWFIAKLVEIITRMGLCSWERVLTVLKEVLWIDRLLEVELHRLWESVYFHLNG